MLRKVGIGMDLRSLSKLLGLSPTTVSRALNGYPEVAEATRQRIFEAARMTGYQANQSARLLAAGSLNAVGVVWTTSQSEQQQRFDTTLFRLLTIMSNEHNLTLLSVPAGSDGGEEQIRRLFTKGMINAALFVNPQKQSIATFPFPVMTFGSRHRVAISTHSVNIDYRVGAHKAANFLAQLGHSSLMVLDNGSQGADEIGKGARESQDSPNAKTGCRMAVSQVHVACAAEHFARFDPSSPLAIMTPDVAAAQDVVRVCAEHGFMLGRNISVIAFDDGTAASIEGPAFTVVRVRLEKLAERILTTLCDSFTDPSNGVGARITIRPDLILGETTATVPHLR